MILFVIVFFVLFPVSALIPLKAGGDRVALSREQSSFYKGVATCFVIMSHMCALMELSGKSTIFMGAEQLGGMGVLIFFFLSGYGLYKAYALKDSDKGYIKKRLVNVLIPYLVIKIVFLTVESMILKDFSLSRITGRFDDWFVDVILIQYVIFYICRKIFSGNRKMLIASCFACNIVLAAVFVLAGLNPRWYNALLLFPSGMVLASVAGKAEERFSGHKIMSLAAAVILFAGSAGLFVFLKDSLLGNMFKTVAGVFLGLIVFILSLLIEFRSPVMGYIGRNSLFFYIIHLEIMKVTGSCFDLQPVAAFIAVIAGTAVIVPLFAFLHNKITGKAG